MEASMIRNQGGIQLLLAAEQEAQYIVTDAKNAKLARHKQAKDEAEYEIAEYRSYMDHEFQREVAGSTGDSNSNVKRLDQETDAMIRHLKTVAARLSADVVNMLLKHTTTVRN